MSARRRREAHGRGQALVEFALVAPLFFLVLFAIIEAGRFMLFYETLNSATREGARYAIVNGANTLGCPTGPPAPGSSPCDADGGDVVARVQQASFGVLGGGVRVVPTWHDPANNSRGATVTVTAEYDYFPVIPIPVQFTITAESSLVVNN